MSRFPLFARSLDNSGYDYQAEKIYAFYVKKDNEYTINLIPCYFIESGVIGMYDTVEGEFYTNAGTGEFLKGNNVN